MSNNIHKLPKWGKVLPERYHTVAGVKLLATDLLRTGEMLEAERLLGTIEAAKLFQPSMSPGDYCWGPKGHGDIDLPLRNGKKVDIDWLNTLVAFADKTGYIVEPRVGYLSGKLGWALAHGVYGLVTRGSGRILLNHMKALYNASELEAIFLAERILEKKLQFGVLDPTIRPPTFRDVLHPDLVREAERVLAESRRRKSYRMSRKPIRHIFEHEEPEEVTWQPPRLLKEVFPVLDKYPLKHFEHEEHEEPEEVPWRPDTLKVLGKHLQHFEHEEPWQPPIQPPPSFAPPIQDQGPGVSWRPPQPFLR